MIEELTNESIGAPWYVRVTPPTKAWLGKPVVLLHGFAESSQTWEEIALPYHPLFAVDLPGHGQSPCPENVEAYSVASLVKQLDTVIDCIVTAWQKKMTSLGLPAQVTSDNQAVHLWGYSLGGRIALAYASSHPHTLRSLGLESAGLGIEDPQARQDRLQSDVALGERIQEKGVDWFAKFWGELPIFHTQHRPAYVEKKKILDARRANNKPLGLANSLKGLGQGVYPWMGDSLHRLTMPVCYVRGEDDAPKFADFQRLVEEKVPAAIGKVAPGIGHNVHWENPALLQDFMMEFLHEVEGLPYNK